MKRIIYINSIMSSPPPSIFTVEDRHIIRLRKMIESACTRAFYILLGWLLPRWDKSKTPFQEYLKTKENIIMKNFKSDLKPSQKEAMKNDKSGNTWDVSLLYLLITWGNDLLACKNDPVWKKKDNLPANLESLITLVKDERNKVMHSYDPIDEEAFGKSIDNIRQLLQDMMHFAGSLCGHTDEVEDILISLNDIIDKCIDDPIDSGDESEYLKQKIKFMVEKGKKELHNLHSKYKTLAPVSFLVQTKVPVDKVYTKMTLQIDNGNGSAAYEVQLENILEGDNQSITDSNILIIGDAGVGKTTLTRKMLKDWIKGNNIIKFLNNFELVFHVECRERIDSFKKLLVYSMPEMLKRFSADQMVYAIEYIRTLIIIDGIDELNNDSTSLFQEILQLKTRNDNFTVLITSRPEAVDMYTQNMRSSHIRTKHISLLGIPTENRDEFVTKYHESIQIDSSNLKSEDTVDTLLKYLKKTESRLGYMWRLPFNLAILVILWISKSYVIESIKTVPELQKEILSIYLEKLEERLRLNEDTKSWPLSKLKRKIETFLYTLCSEALTALVKSNITLNLEAYRRLEMTCHELKIPLEEMLGMFLKQTKTNSGTKYSFPHKSFQDYLSARYIFKQLFSPPLSSNFQNMMTDFGDLLFKYDVPLNASHDIMQFIRNRVNITNSIDSDSSATEPQALETNKIRLILDEREGSKNYDISKYQNPLIYLIGILYQEGNSVGDDVKKEVLNLLEETGVKTSGQWLDVLNGTKCDRFVATYIASKPEILRGNIMVTDSSLYAYISLLQVLECSTKGAENNEMDTGDVEMETGNANISIDIKEGSTCINELLNEVNGKELNVTALYLQHDFRHPTEVVISKYTVNQLFRRAKLRNYKGAFISGLKLPQLTLMRVSIATKEAFDELHTYLERSNCSDLGLCVSPTLNSSDLRPIPGSSLELFLPDVTSEAMNDAVAKTKALQPINGVFTRIFYPRCTLTVDEIPTLLDELAKENVKVTYAVYFPSHLKPSERSKRGRLLRAARNKLGCSAGIEWGRYFINEWEMS